MEGNILLLQEIAHYLNEAETIECTAQEAEAMMVK